MVRLFEWGLTKRRNDGGDKNAVAFAACTRVFLGKEKPTVIGEWDQGRRLCALRAAVCLATLQVLK